MKELDFNKPIEILPKIWWVGYVIPNDPFQCHVYLIENGDESILIDPGSMITFPITLEKVVQITSLRNIKYIIMHHQDPDIVGCYSTLESIMPYREDRRIVTHWRTWMLLKHYKWKTPFYLIDKKEWKLKAGNKELEFVFTPYAHFAGAFCTYDKEFEILFSSDLFGGFTEEFKLFADKEYLEEAKMFHKHYMPSKEVLNYALKNIEEKRPKMILPQHGSIIKNEMVDYMINGLKDLECGLYMMDNYIDDIKILNKIDNFLKLFIEDLILNEDFEVVLKKFFFFLKENLPLKAIKLERDDFCFSFGDNGKKYDNVRDDFSMELIFNNHSIGKLVFEFEHSLNTREKEFLKLSTQKLLAPLSGLFYRYLVLRRHEINEKIFYEESIKDSLTSLYNRKFLDEFLNRKIKETSSFCIAMVDIDYFKKINDNYGHLVGDCVLKELGKLLKNSFRNGDIVARYGGEEFLIVISNIDLENACRKMEEIRKKVEQKIFCKKIELTISIGVSEFCGSSNIENIIKKADDNLYKAKKSGRNKVVCN